MKRFDLSIRGKGFYFIVGHTGRGRRFMAMVEGARDAIAFCDDSRLTRDIANGAVSAGLRVSVNRRRYLGEQS